MNCFPFGAGFRSVLIVCSREAGKPSLPGTSRNDYSRDRGCCFRYIAKNWPISRSKATGDHRAAGGFGDVRTESVYRQPGCPDCRRHVPVHVQAVGWLQARSFPCVRTGRSSPPDGFPQYRAAYDYYDWKFCFGLTATPMRSDGVALGRCSIRRALK